jgi:hypothetical protein
MSHHENKHRGGGPKTPRGKSIARWNALKHGATAKQLFILQGPHLPEFERYRQLAEELQEELGPGAYLEDKVLVQKFVSNALIAERCDHVLLRLLPRGDDTIACEVAPISLRYIAQGQRDFLKVSQLMRELRERVEETEAAEAEAKAEPEAADEQSTAQEQGTDNGVSSDLNPAHFGALGVRRRACLSLIRFAFAILSLT